MQTPSSHQRAHGQFYTRANPFVLRPFKRWLAKAARGPQDTVLEPFAGAGHIPELLREAGFKLPWACFDIDPPGQLASAHAWPVEVRDTLSDFPQGFRLAITNPPYLARNSASRRGLPYPDTAFDDLYKHALAVSLAQVDYLAAIIPESFLTAGVFLDRLDAVISLPWPMFDDTEHPVCLALFNPPGAPAPARAYSGNQSLGPLSRLRAALPQVASHMARPWRFNDPRGSIGLVAIDDHRGPSIAFVPGRKIPASQVKPSSRALTRIAGLPKGLAATDVIAQANAQLAHLRATTHDLVLTPFKGLRADGRYRRRLDFSTARGLLDLAVRDVLGRA